MLNQQQELHSSVAPLSTSFAQASRPGGHRMRLSTSGRSLSTSSLDDDDSASLLSSSLTRRKLAPLRATADGSVVPSLNPLPTLPPAKPRTPSPSVGSPTALSARRSGFGAGVGVGAGASASSSTAAMPSSNRASSGGSARRSSRSSAGESALRKELETATRRVAALEKSNADLKTEGERRERVLEALLKQARSEKAEAQRQLATTSKDKDKLAKDLVAARKSSYGSGGAGSGGSSQASSAAASAQVKAFKMQIDAYKAELDVKDKQIVALRYELEQRPPEARGAPAGVVPADELDLDDDGGFEAVLREEMDTMRAAYEKRLAEMKEQLDRQSLILKRQGEDVTALPTPRG